jgi:ketosteroid isomerase-like protein
MRLLHIGIRSANFKINAAARKKVDPRSLEGAPRQRAWRQLRLRQETTASAQNGSGRAWPNQETPSRQVRSIGSRHGRAALVFLCDVVFPRPCSTDRHNHTPDGWRRLSPSQDCIKIVEPKWEASMTRAEVDAGVNAFFAARRNGDLSGIMKLFATGAEYRVSGTPALGPMTNVHRGRDNIHAAAAAILATWDFTEFPVVQTHIDGATAYVTLQGTMRHIPSGQTMPFEMLDKITFHKGQIVEFVEFFDTYAAVTMVEKDG